MSSPPASTLAAANAVAQAIGAILRAMLDALFGDISGIAPRHPIRRAHARTLRHIERYVAALAAALSTPAAAPDDESEQDAPRPDSVRRHPGTARSPSRTPIFHVAKRRQSPLPRGAPPPRTLWYPIPPHA